MCHCMATILSALDEQNKTLPTYRCGLVNWRSTCNLLGIIQSKDVSDLCSLQNMGNPFAINVGSSDTLAGSASGQIWGNGQHPGGRQRNASHPDVSRSGNSLN